MDINTAKQVLICSQGCCGKICSHCKEAHNIALEALEAINKIIEIIKIEQQPTSCEHTKIKSFEMIEKIISDYQLMIETL